MVKVLRQAALYTCVALTATALLYACSALLHMAFAWGGRCAHSDCLCSLAACFPVHIFTPSVPMVVFWCIDGVLVFFGCWLAKMLWHEMRA